jgi:hypothetical protein
LFCIQVIVVVLIGSDLIKSAKTFSPPSLELLTIRFIAAILLHIQLVGEVRQAMGLMKILVEYRNEFHSKGAPLLICLMQLNGALITEISNIYLICKLESVLDVLISLMVHCADRQLLCKLSSVMPFRQ